jgi:hypothetical protein
MRFDSIKFSPLRAARAGALVMLFSFNVFAGAESSPPAPARDSADSFAPRKVQSRQPEVEKVEEGVYRIGPILVYKKERRFSVPGKIIYLGSPLEFLAISIGGGKAYESLVELESDAIMFNLACILIGLDNAGARRPEYHFDERAVEGQSVYLTLSWATEGGRKEVPAERLLLNEGEPLASANWIYTGSAFAGDGTFLAAQDGTLVGFVHDPSSVIEHETGLGLGDYGAVAGNPVLSPPVSTPVVLTVGALGE